MSILNDLLNAVKGGIEGGLRQALDEVSAPKHNSGDIKPGDVDIKTFALRSADGEKAWSLLPYVSSINIYESIMSPVVYAELDILDTVQLEQNFPIKGEEIVDIEFETPGSNYITYRFIVNGAPINKQVLPNNKGVTYTLKLASIDILANSAINSKDSKGHFVSKRVKGTAADLIKNILQDDLKLELPCKISSTQGIVEEDLVYGLPDYAGMKMTPFRYIDKLRLIAKSNDDKSSAFHFFLNKDGYHFISLEKLMRDGKKEHSFGSDKTFYFDTVRNSDIDSVKFRNILAYNHIQQGSTTDYQQFGGFNSDVTVFDNLSFTVKNITTTDSEAADQFERSDDDAAFIWSPDFMRKFGKASTHSHLIATRADMTNPGYEDKLTNLQSFIAKITQNRLQIEIYGDTELTVGDTIEVNLPPASTADNPPEKMNLVSGLYLVKYLRHMIINGDRPQHIISMELIKHGLLEAAK